MSVSIPADPDTPITPLGPDSLFWRLFADSRVVPYVFWGGTIQNLYPGLAAVVEEHSTVKQEPMQRLLRSLYTILGTAFDGERAHQTSQELVQYHRGLVSTDSTGRRAPALRPDTFYWAHATYIVAALEMAENFYGGFTKGQQEQLFEEFKVIWRQYGIKYRDEPDTLDTFWVYWDHMVSHELVMTQAFKDLFYYRFGVHNTPPRWIPAPLYRGVLNGIGMPIFRLYATGMYPGPVRRLAGLKWTRTHQRIFDAINLVLRLVWRVLPERARMHPRARQGWLRVRGDLPADAPLLTAPPRYAPPPQYRNRPHNFQPIPPTENTAASQ
ncbi:oxygenase MpaB family protein [Mycobacterium aquaticum]|jgi:uncharacterized protein (DUF2236 family)|uniref:ER-bound oxygenase mpaB/mpaB'/Rubber oxygenase catalytic domain-containing protein n=1 Tax=Mycobacterium aquaticum TaxID=1927124 RepID=A0A1X0AIK3_9MYCO|nr:oxygenase MpaB family protein [Mycobacterium aquaticum]ORA29890.1 hypothetical protein BST13_26455 [Mycobacterium aquaticum]